MGRRDRLVQLIVAVITLGLVAPRLTKDEEDLMQTLPDGVKDEGRESAARLESACEKLEEASARSLVVSHDTMSLGGGA